MPGLSINITQKGVTSATIGPRGASVNVGKKGAYLNAGLPGTGIYSRTKIADGLPKQVEPVPQPPALPKASTRSEAYFLGVGIIAIICAVIWWMTDATTAFIAFWVMVILWTVIALVVWVVSASARVAKRHL